MTLTVVKVGGSLYDLPDLRVRLRAWLEALNRPRVLLVPGGGAAANVVRDLDRHHGLGEALAHVIALHALTLNAWFLAGLLDGVPVLDDPTTAWSGVALLDAARFSARDADLPMSWDATSDSVAARAALLLGAEELVLLKSVRLPSGASWEECARAGIVDPIFPSLASGLCNIRIVDLRNWERSNGPRGCATRPPGTDRHG